MLDKIQLIRNVGQFDSVNSAQFDLKKLTFFYAENGRGKTTLAAILRSAGNGNAGVIEERRRLTAQHPPHIVLRDQAGVITYQSGVWSRNIPCIVVFDDRFVSENVCSGMEIETEHRQKLHELILGAQGVTLNTAVQQKVTAIEAHNRQIKSLGDAIPVTVRGRYSVDSFCAIKPVADIDVTIQDAERSLAAAKSADAVAKQSVFVPFSLPAIDSGPLNEILHRDLPELEISAAAQVQSHLHKLGRGGENWIAEGMPFVSSVTAGGDDVCPFCLQGLRGSPIIRHYQAYFSTAYADLKAAIIREGKAFGTAHGGDIVAAFERDVRVAAEARGFWTNFATITELNLDTAEIGRAWKAAREGILAALRAKHASPLERMELSPEVMAAIENYDRHRAEVDRSSNDLQSHNDEIERIKEQTASASIATLEGDLVAAHAIRARFTPALSAACQAYLDAKVAKTVTEQERDRARAALDQYRTTIFPTYENAINRYLRRFGSSFRLGSVASVNNRGGSACNYNVLINDVPVSITADSGPSFRNTLSAGDRNTLALAFFFASLDQDPELARKIVVIDDPMTSLDEHRNRNTLHEMRQLLTRVDQMIVLSHSKSFLCPLWQDATPTLRTALRIDRVRDGQNQDASTITEWNVHADCVSEHDRRHEQISAYIQNSDPTIERAVAADLRPVLESFMRVAYPGVFPPGTLLGHFANICTQRLAAGRQILSAVDIQELREILDYANEFHHDTNPAYQTQNINSQELTDFCRRTLAFTQRS